MPSRHPHPQPALCIEEVSAIADIAAIVAASVIGQRIGDMQSLIGRGVSPRPRQGVRDCVDCVITDDSPGKP